MFDLKCFFLDPYASEKYPHLIETGIAEIVPEMGILRQRLSAFPHLKKVRDKQPDITSVLSTLDSMAAEYAGLCGSC